MKFVEAGGARAIPFKYTDSEEAILAKLQKVNGFLFPGGGASLTDRNGSLSEYSRKGLIVYNYAKKLNNQGVHFPLWGTCLGFEEMAVMEANDEGFKLTGGMDAVNVPSTLEYTKEARKSRLFSAIDPPIVEALTKEKLTFNSHHFGILPEDFEKYQKLHEMFVPLAYSVDQKGLTYVAAYEARKYPFYGVQFHPEKNSFIFHPKLHIPHSQTAVKFNLELAMFFVEESRKNDHQWDSYDEAEKNIA